MFLISCKIITVNICRVMLNKTGERGHLFLAHEFLWDALNCSPLHILVDFALLYMILGFPDGTSGEEHTCQCRRHKRYGFSLWVGKIPWRRAWQPTLVCLPGEAYEQRSLGGYRWSIMLQRVGHDWNDLVCTHAHLPQLSLFSLLGPWPGVR